MSYYLHHTMQRAIKLVTDEESRVGVKIDRETNLAIIATIQDDIAKIPVPKAEDRTPKVEAYIEALRAFISTKSLELNHNPILKGYCEKVHQTIERVAGLFTLKAMLRFDKMDEDKFKIMAPGQSPTMCHFTDALVSYYLSKWKTECVHGQETGFTSNFQRKWDQGLKTLEQWRDRETLGKAGSHRDISLYLHGLLASATTTQNSGDRGDTAKAAIKGWGKWAMNSVKSVAHSVGGDKLGIGDGQGEFIRCVKPIIVGFTAEGVNTHEHCDFAVWKPPVDEKVQEFSFSLN